MHSIEEPEVVNLFFSIVFFFLLYRVLKNRQFEFPIHFITGIVLILMNNVFTVIEGFVLGELFNFLEHFSFMLGTLFFALGALQLRKRI